MMRRSVLFWMAPWLAIGMSAPASAQPPIDVAKACAEWRWIGISKVESQCPEIPGWKGTLLFPSLRSVEEGDYLFCSEEMKKSDACVPDDKLIGKLRRFCVYTPTSSSGVPPPPVSAGLVRIDQDCASISLSGETEAVARKRYSSQFEVQAGARPFTVQNLNAVRLAFLDTEPTGADVSERRGRSPHGYTLARLAQDMVCGEGRCAAHVTTRLALPIISFNSKRRTASLIDSECDGPVGKGKKKCGGYMGLQGDLAQAIQSEVDAWRRIRRKDLERHLVLNLSLAWDGALFGGLDEDTIAEMRAGTQAVYEALEYANGFDVLVLAAAGNQKGNPCKSVGPLLPAAWEIGGPREESCSRRRETPLVYAVGGVRSDGRRLINARELGMPRRAAYGENAMVPPTPAGGPPTILTGSSVSTAVVSSIAAAVWSAFPDRSSRDVMGLLDESGDPLGMADFWFVPAPPAAGPFKVHRLSLCNALQTAWGHWNPTAKADLRCDVWKPVQSLAAPKDWVPDSCDPWVRPQPETPPSLSSGSGLIPPSQ